jgi:putative effector of murein hydrolase
MREIFQQSVYFGVVLSLGSYAVGMFLKRKTGWAIMNPLLVSIVICIVFLAVTGTSYSDYNKGAAWLSYLMTPATVCLAVPLYQQVELLRKNSRAIIAGITSGVLASLTSILLMALAFGWDHTSFVTFLPKSITTAIGISLSAELGGMVPVTVVAIAVTGVFGSVVAESFLKFLRIKEPVAKGIALGSASHVIGTARAMEMGAIEGATSGLSIVVSGVMTVVLGSLFAMLL